MTKNITVNVVGIQSGGDLTSKERIETSGNGTYYVRDNFCYALYDEEDDRSGEKVSNMLKFSARKAEITRKGNTSTKMVFEPNKETLSVYETPYGRFDLKIKTKALSVMENAKKIIVSISYDMSINEGKAVNCSTTVTINSEEE